MTLHLKDPRSHKKFLDQTLSAKAGYKIKIQKSVGSLYHNHKLTEKGIGKTIPFVKKTSRVNVLRPGGKKEKKALDGEMMFHAHGKQSQYCLHNLFPPSWINHRYHLHQPFDS